MIAGLPTVTLTTDGASIGNPGAGGFGTTERLLSGPGYLLDYQDTHQVQQARMGGLLDLLRQDPPNPRAERATFLGSDHAAGWLRDGRMVRVSYQVYAPLDHRHLRAMLNFCLRHDLTLVISPRSFHFFGRTLLLDVTRQVTPDDTEGQQSAYDQGG